MTRARVTAQQLTRPPRPARLVRGTVSAVSPLTVKIAGGAEVGGIPIPGASYTVGAAVLVLAQEPGVGPVYPIPGTTGIPAAVLPPIPAASFAGIPTITALDTAPDGFAFLPAGSNPFGDGGCLIETFTASISGTPWRMQALTSEQSGGRRTRASYAGAWGTWAGGSARVAPATGTTVADWGAGGQSAGQNVLTRVGPLVSVKWQITVGTTVPAVGWVLGNIPAGFRPASPAYHRGILYTGAWNQSADLEIDTAGTIVLRGTTAAIGAGHGIFLNTTYPAA